MKLSIITINYNNAAGLEKTLQSVYSQTCREFEHIVVDGASNDGSVGMIEKYAQKCTNFVRWISEPDKGIYNAMNKGIRMVSGDYIQILNSGDCLASEVVIEQMFAALERTQYPAVLYGNMLKINESGRIIGGSRETPCSLLQFYASTLNHDCAYIKRNLFETGKYGLYDESLKVVSDWKWYLQAIGLGKVKPVYVDVDVTLFDAGGISETNLDLRDRERRKVLEEVLPPAVLADYDKYAFTMLQYERLKRHHLWGIVWFVERVLFKFEKWFG